MVTVRLSDPPAASTFDTSFQAQNDISLLQNHQFQARRETTPANAESKSNIHENAVILKKESQDIERESTISMASTMEEDRSLPPCGSPRSRSNTSGSFSSNGSAQVDWDELERSEEQAPRDEGSDEVGPFHVGMILLLTLH